jgi:hypothetical protein
MDERGEVIVNYLGTDPSASVVAVETSSPNEMSFEEMQQELQNLHISIKDYANAAANKEVEDHLEIETETPLQIFEVIFSRFTN